MSTTLSKFYHVRKEDVLKLEIKIGHGQLGVTTIHLGDKVLAAAKEGSFTLPIPGNGEELQRKTLICSTTIADIQPNIDETSITYSLTGGVKSFKQTLQESADDDDKVVPYVATFTFYL